MLMERARFIAESNLESYKILLYPSPKIGAKIKATLLAKNGLVSRGLFLEIIVMSSQKEMVKNLYV